MKSCAVLIAVLLLTTSKSLWAGSYATVTNLIIIDPKAAAALTNRTEQLLHEIKIPSIEFAQADLHDVLQFLNAAIQEYAKTEESKQITIVFDPDTEKELKKRNDTGNNWSGIAHAFTFAGLRLSVLEVVQHIQTEYLCDRRVEGNKLILSMKKDKQVQQTSPGDSSTRDAGLGTPKK